MSNHLKEARKGEKFSSNNITIPICNLKYMKTVSDWIALYFQNIAATRGGSHVMVGETLVRKLEKESNWGVAQHWLLTIQF